MTTLALHPGVYPSAGQFRPVIRLYRNGKPCGSKASPHRFASQAEAEAFARSGALTVALNMHRPTEGVLVVVN